LHECLAARSLARDEITLGLDLRDHGRSNDDALRQLLFVVDARVVAHEIVSESSAAGELFTGVRAKALRGGSDRR
jgi:hypothetical protein